MWQLSISIDKDKAEFLEPLCERMTPLMQKIRGAIVRDESHMRAVLSIACEDEDSHQIIGELDTCLTDIIITDFKHQYLLKHSRLPIENAVNYNAFLRALVAFDREFDRQLVFEKLARGNHGRHSCELPLDGFFNFRLKELKSRWLEVCKLANDNSCYLEYHDTFLELLKFLVKTIDCKLAEATVMRTNDGYRICDCRGKSLPPALYSLDKTITDENLLPALIHLSPEKIIIAKDCHIPSDILSLIQSLYEDKVVLG